MTMRKRTNFPNAKRPGMTTMNKEERERAEELGVSEEAIEKASEDMQQAKRDKCDCAECRREEKRLAYVDYLRTENRCTLSVDELLDLDLDKLRGLYRDFS